MKILLAGVLLSVVISRPVEAEEMWTMDADSVELSSDGLTAEARGYSVEAGAVRADSASFPLGNEAPHTVKLTKLEVTVGSVRFSANGGTFYPKVRVLEILDNEILVDSGGDGLSCADGTLRWGDGTPVPCVNGHSGSTTISCSESGGFRFIFSDQQCPVE